ncbi:MAG: hypothetical protein NC180_10010 [Muribaculaceae bacterium]|nr:hypothetical protein [Roseburia sp.]MCM1431936.1 hypothetical protein [Muribaculaceae bacterium]MCM1493544.1 hypothetical protein [Muribaculaceae bacterium]
MKQVILGLLGTAIVIYTVVSCLSIYSISSRRNEMENCLATVLKQNMDEYYVRLVPTWVKKEKEEEKEAKHKKTGRTDKTGGKDKAGEKQEDGETEEDEWEIVYVPVRKCSDAQVEAFVKQDLTGQLRSDSKVRISVYACDMEQGILSVGITEQFYLPNGMKKTIQCSKTLVVE